MSRPAYDLLFECFRATGADEVQASKAADTALNCLLAAEIIQQSHLETWERDATIYHRRGQRVTIMALTERFGVNRSRICLVLKRHLSRRRAALQAARDAA